MKSILFVVAHPDDVAAGMGGTALLLKGKYELHVICATKGERGVPGQSLAETGAIREQEEREACGQLSATLHFLGRMDGELFADRETSMKVVDIIISTDPVAIFTIWPVDSHPDHSAISEITKKGIFLSGKNPELIFSEEGSSQTSHFTPDLYVDISDVIEKKMELIRCHTCQNRDDRLAPLFLEKSVLRGKESGFKHAEGFKTLLSPDTGSILRTLKQMCAGRLSRMI